MTNWLLAAILMLTLSTSCTPQGGSDGVSDIEKYRPRGNEIAHLWIEGGQLVGFKEEKPGYGKGSKLVLQCPVDDGCGNNLHNGENGENHE